ncbi:hypothetical protein LMG22037_00087 [Paraburkholderia phenoliruptrix]|uniref:Uncharacterized protein n=1 Tax=Paraburkholderia phenoliruptrix TaxID=252970 RepID=A0A6J4ZP18_9BURK|nr:hypothetical protein LMG22037_00087 [Paraburkholderia phenoliruptrix]
MSCPSMSCVSLTLQYAYKLKKAVHYDQLDFRTLEARQFYCNEELRLNRRLAESVYLGVVPLVVNPQGTIQLGGKGAVVDWLVEMHRLPAHRMLDWALLHGTAGSGDAHAVARRLAEFHMKLHPEHIARARYRRRTRAALCQPIRFLRERADCNRVARRASRRHGSGIELYASLRFPLRNDLCTPGQGMGTTSTGRLRQFPRHELSRPRSCGTEPARAGKGRLRYVVLPWPSRPAERQAHESQSGGR